MGLHITRVEIQNFRNFEHLILDSFPEQAVIVGENGTGKSNFLHALRLVLDPSLSDASRLLREEDIWEGHPAGLSGGAIVTVTINLAGFDDDDDAKAVLSNAIVDVDPYVASLTYRFEPKVGVAVEQSPDGSAAISAESRPLTHHDYDFIVFGGIDDGTDIRRIRRDVGLRVLPALRDAETDLRSWRHNPLRELLERLPLDPENLAKTASAVADAVTQLAKDKNVNALQDHINARLTEMVGPRLPMEPVLGFASTQPDELVRAVRLFLDTEMRHGITDASLGSANVIYLGLLIEALAQQRHQDLFVATVLAVEEPEAHLHVSLQRRLFKYLLRSEQGLLLTTHSPHIAAVAPLGSFVLLREHGTAVAGTTTAGIAINGNTRGDLERYLDVTRAEVLFANCVIFVEGIAEAYLLPAMATALGFDIDSFGVVVSSINGTDFAPYRTLVGSDGLRIPHLIVTDGDASGDKRGVTEAGLRRAARLSADTTQREQLLEQIASLPGREEPTYMEERSKLIRAVAGDDIFVGQQTLETDICHLVHVEMGNAFAEIKNGDKARKKFASGVENELKEAPDDETRKNWLKQISAIGKGRYAQRLAGHVEARHLTASLSIDLALSAEDDVPQPSHPAEMVNVGGGWHLVAALERASLLTRGASLFQSSPTETD